MFKMDKKEFIFYVLYLSSLFTATYIVLTKSFINNYWWLGLFITLSLSTAYFSYKFLNEMHKEKVR
tara:strand:- start:641 stop:838 length:198 start_codon:yes stop_codon:yes gene_type:complete